MVHVTLGFLPLLAPPDPLLIHPYLACLFQHTSGHAIMGQGRWAKLWWSLRYLSVSREECVVCGVGKGRGDNTGRRGKGEGDGEWATARAILHHPMTVVIHQYPSLCTSLSVSPPPFPTSFSPKYGSTASSPPPTSRSHDTHVGLLHAEYKCLIDWAEECSKCLSGGHTQCHIRTWIEPQAA